MSCPGRKECSDEAVWSNGPAVRRQEGWMTASAVRQYERYPYRWVVFFVYGLIMCTQAFLWLSFTPISTSVEKALGVGATQVKLLALVGPFMFIVFASYAGNLADRKGWKFATGLGILMLIAAGAVRALVSLTVSGGALQYWLYLAMQVLAGTGSVFAMVNLSKMPIKWFPERQRALANGLTTMSMYLGTAVGLPLVTAVANISDEATAAQAQAGLERVLVVTALIMVASGALFFALAREEPPGPAGPMPQTGVSMGLWDSLARFLKLPAFRALAFVSLLGYGIYIGLTVTMENLMRFHGFTAEFASLVAAGITLGGIVGAAVIPGLSEKVRVRKPFLVIATVVNIPAILVIGFVSNQPLDMLAGVIGGLVLLPALPVTFTIVGEMEEIGPRLAGTAVGTLLAVGSIGSAGIPLLMELGIFARKTTVEGVAVTDYRWGMVFLVALAVAGLFAIIKYVRETGPGRSPST